MHIKAAGLSAILALSLSSLAFAGPAADAAEEAETLQADGKPLEALTAIDASIDALCDSMPLQFRKVVTVTSSDGYGLYEARGDQTFQPDEKMLIYVEPACYGFGSEGGMQTIGLTADIAIENTTGQVLGEADDVFSVSAASANKKREFSMTLSFLVPYLRPGDYQAVFVVRDQNSSKSGSFEVPFTVTTPAAQ